MSDTENKIPAEEEMKLTLDGNSVDWFLQTLVSIANKTGMKFGITLTVGGSIVSGKLVGGKEYFETFASEFSSSWPDDGSRADIYDSLAQNGKIYPQTENSDGQEAGDEANNNLPPQFIHLIDSRCFYPGRQLPDNKGVLWRGKINAVSGFSLGQLSADNEE